jgi:hypothetical protein
VRPPNGHVESSRYRRQPSRRFRAAVAVSGLCQALGVGMVTIDDLMRVLVLESGSKHCPAMRRSSVTQRCANSGAALASGEHATPTAGRPLRDTRLGKFLMCRAPSGPGNHREAWRFVNVSRGRHLIETSAGLRFLSAMGAVRSQPLPSQSTIILAAPGDLGRHRGLPHAMRALGFSRGNRTRRVTGLGITRQTANSQFGPRPGVQ